MGPTERITPADRLRFETMRELGCLVSRVFHRKPFTEGEVHHLLAGGQRRGHQITIYLHPWYHRGVPPQVMKHGALRQLTVGEAAETYGPSLALDRREFEICYGREEELLEMQNALIEAWLQARAA